MEKGTGGGGKNTGDGPEAKGGFRVPSMVMVPVGLAVGWIVGNWMGANFGGVIGLFLWRSRA